MFAEDDLIPISALQHVAYCERQYALIHLEQLWQENQYTAEGQILHEKVDVTRHESRRSFRQEYGMAIRSLRHGLIGKADLVELRLDLAGRMIEAEPIEFKRGKTKKTDVDCIQLCAQALCLEEMFNIPVVKGQFYYLGEHRRVNTEITESLRLKTLFFIERIQCIMQSRQTPLAVYEPQKCDRCSLLDQCLPKSAGAGAKNTDRFIQAQLRAIRSDGVI